MAHIDDDIAMLSSNEDLEAQEAALKEQMKEMQCAMAEKKHKI